MATLRTGLTPEDRIENEVRKRMAERLSAAGVNRGRISLEVLYWLPADFVRVYMQVVEMAVRMDDSLSSAMGGSVGDEGKASIATVGGGPRKGKTAGGLFTRTSGAHAKGGGRYMRHWIVKDDNAMRLKASIDRRIRRAIEEAVRDFQSERDAAKVDQWISDLTVAGVMTHEEAGKKAMEMLKKFNPGLAAKLNPGEEVGEPMEKISTEPVERILQEGRCVTCGKIGSAKWVLCPHPHKNAGGK